MLINLFLISLYFSRPKKRLVYNGTRCATSFQASEATIYKITNLSYHYITKQDPNFHSFLIVSKDVKTKFPTELICDCDDLRLSTHGLPCRVDCVINYFYNNLTEPWLFVGGDDDWINFDALSRLLDALEESYNPFEEPIFLGNLQQMYNMSFPHGGPGWLASRHFVHELLQQKLSIEKLSNERGSWATDDVSMGIILREKFPDLRFWANPWSLVALPHPSWLSIIKNKRWEKLKKCPNDVQRVSLRDVFTVHNTPFNVDWIDAIKNFPEAPPEVKIMTTKFVVSEFCLCTSKWCDLRLTKESVKKRIKPPKY